MARNRKNFVLTKSIFEFIFGFLNPLTGSKMCISSEMGPYSSRYRYLHTFLLPPPVHFNNLVAFLGNNRLFKVFDYIDITHTVWTY